MQASMSTSEQERKNTLLGTEEQLGKGLTTEVSQDLHIKQKAAAMKLKLGWWFRQQVPRALWKRKPGISAISQCLEQLY